MSCCTNLRVMSYSGLAGGGGGGGGGSVHQSARVTSSERERERELAGVKPMQVH